MNALCSPRWALLCMFWRLGSWWTNFIKMCRDSPEPRNYILLVLNNPPPAAAARSAV